MYYNKKVLDLILEINETRVLLQHKSCKCKRRLNENAWNSKQKWNHDDC